MSEKTDQALFLQKIECLGLLVLALFRVRVIPAEDRNGMWSIAGYF